MVRGWGSARIKAFLDWLLFASRDDHISTIFTCMASAVTTHGLDPGRARDIAVEFGARTTVELDGDAPCQEEDSEDVPGWKKGVDTKLGQEVGDKAPTGQGEEAGDALDQDKHTKAVPDPVGDVQEAPGLGKDTDGVPSSDALPNPGTEAGNESLYLPSDKSNAEVQVWLTRFLPRLPEVDAATYHQRLINDGFDCIESLQFITKDGLHFMKVGHRRRLLANLSGVGA